MPRPARSTGPTTCWPRPGARALIVGDKVYVGDEDGDIAVFNLSADPKKAMREIKDEDGESKLYPINVRETDPGRWDVVNMGNAVYSTPDRRQRRAVHRQQGPHLRHRSAGRRSDDRRRVSRRLSAACRVLTTWY